MSAALLRTEELSGGYGSLRILHDVAVEVGPAEIVALVGPNGAGKSTLLSVLSGLLPATTGRITFDGQDITGLTTRQRMDAGLVHVLEGHRVIPSLSVEENLLIPLMRLHSPMRRTRIEEAFAAFPDLALKRAHPAASLSGGQQQMLVVGQGMVRRPRLLMLDEPSAGLSPVLIDRVLFVLATLASGGTAVLLVEQAVDKALSVASRVYALVHGRVVLDVAASAARQPGVIENAYLGRHPQPTTSVSSTGN